VSSPRDASESGLELGAVVGLHRVNPERQAAHDVVDELDGGHLQAVSRLWLLVALPALAVWLVLLIRREPIQPVSRQDAMNGRTFARALDLHGIAWSRWVRIAARSTSATPTVASWVAPRRRRAAISA